MDENISEERWDMTGNPASVASAVLQLAAAHQPFNVLKGAPYNCVDADASVTGGQFGIPSKGWWECESLPNGSQLRLWSEAQFWPILAEYRQTFIVQLVKLGLTSAGRCNLRMVLAMWPSIRNPPSHLSASATLTWPN